MALLLAYTKFGNISGLKQKFKLPALMASSVADPEGG